MIQLCVLDVQTVDAYQKNAKIADQQSVQIVLGKSVAAGIVLIN